MGGAFGSRLCMTQSLNALAEAEATQKLKNKLRVLTSTREECMELMAQAKAKMDKNKRKKERQKEKQKASSSFEQHWGCLKLAMTTRRRVSGTALSWALQGPHMILESMASLSSVLRMIFM